MILRFAGTVIEILYVNFMFLLVMLVLIIFPLIGIVWMLDNPSDDLRYQDGCYPVLYDGCE